MPGEPAQVIRTREQALALSPRISIDTPALTGSIALKGGRIDDVSLKNYRETIDPKSPMIVLLSPLGSENPYYAETGYVGAPGANLALPNANTVWTANTQKLTPATPVELSWDNGQGLVFRRNLPVTPTNLWMIKAFFICAFSNNLTFMHNNQPFYKILNVRNFMLNQNNRLFTNMPT